MSIAISNEIPFLAVTIFGYYLIKKYTFFRNELQPLFSW